MGRAGAGRQQVELLDADEDLAAPARRRARWWWVAAPLVLVAVLLVVQSVVDDREQAAVDRLSSLPGVVSPVAPSVAVRWSPGAGADGIFASGFESDGAVVGLVYGDDGSQQLVAFDQLTGARRWSTTVLEADPDAVLTPRGVSVDGCRRSGDDAVCLAGDTYLEYGNNPPELVEGDRSSIVTVAVQDGSVVSRRPAPGVTSFAVLPGLVVTGAPTRAGGLVVAALDSQTGAVRWTHRQEPVQNPLHGLVFTAAGGVGVWMPPGRVTLLDPEGSVVRADADAQVRYSVEPSSGVAVVSSTDASGRRVSSDVRAGPVVTYPGTRVELGVDDGSVPGLVLTSGAALDAYDRDTGRRRWSLPGVGIGDALVMLGRVYLLTSGGVQAVDGSSGAQVWRAPVTGGALQPTLLTDGRHILAAVRHEGSTELVAYALDTGHEDWRTTLPDKIDAVSSSGHLLIGFRTGVPSVLG